MSDRLALLERAQQGDDRAEAQLLTENAGLIWSIVRRYNGCGVETDDLYQLGCIGFVKAVKGLTSHTGRSFPPMPCRKSPARYVGSSGMTVR